MNLRKLLPSIFLFVLCASATAQIGTESYKLDSIERSTIHQRTWKPSSVYIYTSNHYGQFTEMSQTTIDLAGNRNAIMRQVYDFSDTSYLWTATTTHLKNPSTQTWQNSQRVTRDYQNGLLAVQKQFSYNFATSDWDLNQQFEYSYDTLGKLIKEETVNIFSQTPPILSRKVYVYNQQNRIDSILTYSPSGSDMKLFMVEVHQQAANGLDTNVTSYRYVDSNDSYTPVQMLYYTLNNHGDYDKQYTYNYNPLIHEWRDTQYVREYGYYLNFEKDDAILPESWHFVFPGQKRPRARNTMQRTNDTLRWYDRYELFYSPPVPKPTGIQEEIEIGFRVYPNPSQHHFFIQLDEPDDRITWKLLSGNGQVIFDGEGKEVDASSLSPGVYFLEVKGRQVYGTQRVIRLP